MTVFPLFNLPFYPEHACSLPIDPINGYANCTEDPEAVFCTFTCEDGYAFAMRPEQDYFCAYDGVWRPDNSPLNFPDCSGTGLIGLTPVHSFSI